MTCGLIFKDNVMVVFPEQLASFLEVSRKFVDRHLKNCGWYLREPTIAEYDHLERLFEGGLPVGFFLQHPPCKSAPTSPRLFSSKSLLRPSVRRISEPLSIQKNRLSSDPRR
jgi:hypothetical protein